MVRCRTRPLHEDKKRDDQREDPPDRIRRRSRGLRDGVATGRRFVVPRRGQATRSSIVGFLHRRSSGVICRELSSAKPGCPDPTEEAHQTDGSSTSSRWPVSFASTAARRKRSATAGSATLTCRSERVQVASIVPPQSTSSFAVIISLLNWFTGGYDGCAPCLEGLSRLAHAAAFGLPTPFRLLKGLHTPGAAATRTGN